MKIKLYDNTRLSAFKKCPRKFFLRHVLHWTTDYKNINLAFGSAWHSGMDSLWQFGNVQLATDAWCDSMLEDGIEPGEIQHRFGLNQFRTEGTAKEMFKGYLERNENFLSKVELIQCELPFCVPLGEEGGMYYVGRIDKAFKMDRKVCFAEHKTTSAYKKDGPFRVDFMNSFSPNSQIDGYQYAGVLIFGDEFRTLYVDAALVHKTIHNGFLFIPVNSKLQMLDIWLQEAIYFANTINLHLTMYETQGLSSGCFPRNTESCGDYSGCGYRDICRYQTDPSTMTTPEHYIIQAWSPFDKLQLAEIGQQFGFGEEEHLL